MTGANDDLDQLIDTMAAIVDLPIAEDYRPGVRHFLDIARTMSAKLDDVTLDDDELALAPVFTPPDIPA